jgi:hypothetical protein
MDYLKKAREDATRALIEYLRGDHDELRDAVIMNCSTFDELPLIDWYMDLGNHTLYSDQVNEMYEARGADRFSIDADLFEMAYCISFVLVFTELEKLIQSVAAEHESANF